MTAAPRKFEAPAAVMSAEDIRRCREIALQRRDVIQEIASAVASETGVPVRAIYGKNRTRQITEARQLVMFIAHERGITTTMIGMALDRDHSTVVHGIKAERMRRLKAL